MIHLLPVFAILILIIVCVELGRAAGKRSARRRYEREQARQAVWDNIESTIRKGEDPAVNSFTMVHAIDNLIAARIKLANLGGDA